MKKTWIKIKRGFLQPEHRDAIGIRVWLYMFMVDQADWDTGVIYDWKDQNAADELGMPIGTLRQQRQELENKRYIDCVQSGNHQKITILKWVDPRSYSGEVLNNTDPCESEGTNEGHNKGEYKGLKKSVPLHCTHKSLTINQEVHKNNEPIYEPFNNQADMPQSFVDEDKPQRKSNVSPEQGRLADTISSLLGIKKPICNNKKDYAALSVTWWKPINEMLRQVDGDIEKAERIVDDVIVAYRAAKLTMNSPKSLLNGFIGELVNNNKPRKSIGVIDGEEIYE